MTVVIVAIVEVGKVAAAGVGIVACGRSRAAVILRIQIITMRRATTRPRIER